MDISETIKLKNLPSDIKLAEALISSSYGEFIGQNPEVMITEVEITFKGGTPTKEIRREMK